MNPLLISALGTALPGLAQGVGNYLGNMGRGVGNAQAAVMMNTPGANPMAMGEDMANRNWENFGPNSQRGQQSQQLSDRQVMQSYNMQNKAADQNMRRNYGIDAYKQAMGMAGGAIDSYLNNNSQLMGSFAQTLNNRY